MHKMKTNLTMSLWKPNQVLLILKDPCQLMFTFTKMRVQFRIDNFVNVELRSLSGSIHSTIYVLIHDFIFIQRGRVLVGKRIF